MTRIQIPEPYRALAAEARKQGWSLGRNKQGHLTWTSPANQVVTSSGTPGDSQSVRNLEQNLRAAGLTVNGRGSNRSQLQGRHEGSVPDSTTPVRAPAVSQDVTEKQELRELLADARHTISVLRQERESLQNTVLEVIAGEFRQLSQEGVRGFEEAVAALISEYRTILKGYANYMKGVVSNWDRGLQRYNNVTQDILKNYHPGDLPTLEYTASTIRYQKRTGDIHGIPEAFRKKGRR